MGVCLLGRGRERCRMQGVPFQLERSGGRGRQDRHPLLGKGGWLHKGGAVWVAEAFLPQARMRRGCVRRAYPSGPC